jgi:hypothetical protein
MQGFGIERFSHRGLCLLAGMLPQAQAPGNATITLLEAYGHPPAPMRGAWLAHKSLDLRAPRTA